MRNKTTVLGRPKTWITVALALGHAVIIAALALSAQRPPVSVPVRPGPSILECLQTEPPGQR